MSSYTYGSTDGGRLFRNIQLVALALAATLFAYPLAGFAACWQQDMARASCPSPCPMSHTASPPHLGAEASGDGSCCQILPAGPTSLATAVKKTVANLIVAAPPEASALVASLPTPEPMGGPSLAPHSTTSSLQALHCVFLI